MVVEVVSPHDESWLKFDHYAAHGVDEVLIADPQDSTLHLFVLVDGSYQPADASQLLGGHGGRAARGHRVAGSVLSTHAANLSRSFSPEGSSMAVKLRLTRVGKTKQPQYRIVAADSRSPRDGRFIEIVGHYNPRTDPSTLTVDNDKAVKWLQQGAQPTDRVRKLLEISGALEQFGAAKGATSERATTPATASVRPRPQPCSPTSSRRSSTIPPPSRSRAPRAVAACASTSASGRAISVA